jgi:hypothetical protein
MRFLAKKMANAVALQSGEPVNIRLGQKRGRLKRRELARAFEHKGAAASTGVKDRRLHVTRDCRAGRRVFALSQMSFHRDK